MAKEPRPKAWLLNSIRALTTSRAILAGAIVFSFGLGLIVLARTVPVLQSHPTLQSIIKDIGGLLIAGLALSVIWEVVTKRTFIDEILATVRIAESVREAGIIRVFNDFDNDIDWARLFADITEFDVFLSYGRTWRNHVMRHLQTLANDRGATVRILMANHQNDELMAQLSHRFGRDTAALKQDCREAEAAYREIFANCRCKFELFLVDSAPVYTYYRFGARILVPYYKNQRKRGTVPALLVDKRGSLYHFFLKDFNGVMSGIESQAAGGTLDEQG